MSGLLLDTHVWIWSQNEPHRLPVRMSTQIESNRNDLWLSPISVWELLLLIDKGRYELSSSEQEWLSVATASLKQATLTYEIVVASRRMTIPHHDPADRFIAATAKVLGLTLLTLDGKLMAASKETGEFAVFDPAPPSPSRKKKRMLRT
jgi:PIN domain nuclease of toxin-antitoxin system